MTDSVKYLPPPYTIYTHLRTYLSAQTTAYERVKFAHCLRYDEPITYHEIFKTLYYLPIVKACHMERIRHVAQFIWKLGTRRGIEPIYTHVEKRFLPRQCVIYSQLGARFSFLIQSVDRIKFAKRFHYKKPITYDRLFRKLYYLNCVVASDFQRIKRIADFIWQLGKSEKHSKRKLVEPVSFCPDDHLMRDCQSSSSSESSSDHYIDIDLCPSPPEDVVASTSSPLDFLINAMALATIHAAGFRTKFERSKYTSYNSLDSIEGSLPEGCSGSGTPIDLQTIGAYELMCQRGLELVAREGRPAFKKLIQRTQKKKELLLQNFFNLETS